MNACIATNALGGQSSAAEGAAALLSCRKSCPQSAKLLLSQELPLRSSISAKIQSLQRPKLSEAAAALSGLLKGGGFSQLSRRTD